MDSTVSADAWQPGMSAARVRRRTWNVLVPAAACILLVQMLPQSTAVIDEAGAAALTVLAAIAFVGGIRMRSDERMHTAWTLLAGGQICFAVWHVTQFWIPVARHSVFSVEDALYLAYFLLVCLGLVLQPMRSLTRVMQLRLKLDVALIAAASSMLYGILILNGMRLSNVSEASPVLFQLIMNILLMWVFSLTLLRQTSSSPAQLAYGLGLLILAAGNVVSALVHVGLTIEWRTREFDTALSTMSSVVVLAAALLHVRGVRWPTYDYGLPAVWRVGMRKLDSFFVEFLLPYGWSIGAIGLFLLTYGYYGAPLAGIDLAFSIAGTTLILFISVARRWLTLEENATLSQRQARVLHAARVLAKPLDLRSAPLHILEQAGGLAPNDEAILFIVRESGDFGVTVWRAWDGISASGASSQESADAAQLLAQGTIGVLTTAYEHEVDRVRATTILRLLHTARRMLWKEVEPPALREWIVVPLRAEDEKVGVLVLGSQTGEWDVQEHLVLLDAYGQQAAATIVNARLRQKQTDMAAMAERSRLSRELHDSVLQAIFGCSLGLRTAQHYIEPANSAAHDALSYSLRLVDGAISEMRALIFELRPETLANEGLVAALQKQAQSLCDRHSIQAAVRSYGGEPALADSVKETFYRIAIEALQNVIKHARARAVQIDVYESAERVCMVINDDGIGFDPRGDFRGHLGLSTMHERAAQIGAALVLTSAPGSGTRIELCVRGMVTPR